MFAVQRYSDSVLPQKGHYSYYALLESHQYFVEYENVLCNVSSFLGDFFSSFPVRKMLVQINVNYADNAARV